MMAMMMGGAKYGVGGASIMTSPDLTSSPSPDPPSPVHSDSSNSNVPPLSPSGRFRGGNKECGVCGDVAKSMHFGGLSCDSCKAFFRRSVQNNAYKGFSCPYEKKCDIGVSSRKACQYCRFEKCISIGMEKGWVMTEDERRKMMEQRREKKNKQSQENAQRQHDAALYSLSEDDRNEIANIVQLYKRAHSCVPYEEGSGGAERGNGQNPSTPQASQAGGSFLLGSWMTFCKRIAYFFSLFSDFAELSSSDQSLLMRTAITSAGIIMGSVVYDSNNGKWAAKVDQSKVKNAPNVSSQSVEKLVPRDLICRVDKFFKKFQQICPDETMAMILILVSLYTPELMGLEARDHVQRLQERYIHILQNYVKFKFHEKSSVMFPKAIVSLADIRELADRTAQMRIQEKSVSMFSNILSSTAPALGGLGSPYSGISLPQNISPPPSGNEVATVTYSMGPKNDPIYERIMKVLYQTQSSTFSSRTPTFLPLIIQILKKWAHARQEGRVGRSLMSGSRKTHRHTRPKGHRGSIHRSRRTSVKRESPSHEDYEDCRIKEEVMDHTEDSILHMGAEAGHTMAQDIPFAASVNSQEFMEAFPQIQQQHFNSPNICPPPTPPDITQPHATTIYQPTTIPEIPETRNTFLATSQNTFCPDDSPITYPHAMSPAEETGYHTLPQQPLQQQSMAQSPQPLSLSPHLQTTPESPHTPSVSPFLPTQQMSPSIQLGSVPQQEALSPYETGLSSSPYSSSSSSSSPEDAGAGFGEIFNKDLTEAESRVIQRLMERVYNSEATGNVTDILPLPLLEELQNQLCHHNAGSPRSASSSPNLMLKEVSSVGCVSPSQGSPFGIMELQQSVDSMGICMEMDSGTLNMDPNVLGLATPSPVLDIGPDTMEIDVPASMKTCS